MRVTDSISSGILVLAVVLALGGAATGSVTDGPARERIYSSSEGGTASTPDRAAGDLPDPTPNAARAPIGEFTGDKSAVTAPDGDPLWVATNGPPGGRIITLALDPEDPDKLFAGGNGGALFISEDAGASWATTSVFAPQNEDFIEVLVDPITPANVYALVLWDTLYVTNDGGASWDAAFDPPSGAGLTDAAMSSTNPRSLIVGGSTIVSVTADGGQTWVDVSASFTPDVPVLAVAAGGAGEFWVATDEGDGHLFHTVDGGVNWQDVDLSVVQPAETRILDLWVDPADPSTLIVGLFFVSNLGGQPGDASLLRTRDRGGTWEALYLPGPRVSALIAGYDPAAGTLYASSLIELFKSDDRGDTWDTVGLPRTITAVDPVQVAVDPRDSDVLYLPTRAEGAAKSVDGGSTWQAINQGISANTSSLLATPNELGSDGLLFAVGAPGLFRSRDWGRNWARLDKPDIDHPYFDELVVSPHDPDEVWAITDTAQLYVSRDGGDTWAREIDSRYGNGFRFGSIYAMAVAPSDAKVIYAVKAGFGIFRSIDNGQTWRFLRRSEVDYSYSLAVHPNDPNIVYSGYNPKPFQDFGMVRRSVDGGDTWNTALTLVGADGVTSVVVDPNNPSRVYAAGPSENGALLRVSNDSGTSWDRLGGLDFTNIHAMTASPNNPDEAAAALWGGGVFYTWDDGLSWTEIFAPTRSASAVMVGGEGNTLYVADRNSPRIYKATIPDAAANDWGHWNVVFDAGADHYRILTAALAGGDSDVIYASVFSERGSPLEGAVFRIAVDGVTDVTNNLSVLPVALAIDPSNPFVVYAAIHTAGGGVYRLDGEAWTLLSGAGSGIPQSPALGFLGIVAAADGPSTVLYLMGGSDAYFTGAGIAHTGADPEDLFTVYRSGDGGTTWTNLNDGHLGADSGPIKGLAADPHDASTLFVAGTNGVFSSTDGGTGWADVSAGLGYTPTAGVGLSSDGNTLYIPTLGGGMFIGSPNADATVVWEPGSRLAASVEHVQLLVDPADSQRVFASAYPGGVFLSTDGGDTWSERNFGLPSFEVDDPLRQGYYALALAPSDPDVVYLGLYGVGVYRSIDGTATWLAVGDQANPIEGAPITALVVDPDTADHVFAATEDGVLESNDGGATWVSFDTGLDTTDVRTLTLDSSGRLLAGTRGYEVYTSSSGLADWTQLEAFDNWGALWPIWADRPLYQYSTVLFHPTNPNIIYVGTFPSGIFRSDDGGMSWREWNVGWTNDGVFSLRTHPDNPDTVFAGTYNGLSRSLDGGGHWETWDAGWPEQQWVFSIDFDPRDPDVMYAASKNGENEGLGSEALRGTVMKSTDGGATWFEITDGLDVAQEFYAVVVDPHNPDVVYLGTQREGVWISREGGKDGWSPWSEGLTNPYAGSNGNNVTSNLVLSADHRFLYFGTAGSGIFRRRIAEDPAATFDDVPADHLFFKDIEWLAAAGITRGCNPPLNNRFCPGSFVTRGQLAAFLVRALGLADDGGGDLFVDDNDSVFEGDIDRLGTAGITRGCNPPANDRFCPTGKVTRGQMAAFLVRALRLTDDGGGDLFVDDDDSVFEGDIDRLGTAGITRGCNPPANDRFCPSSNVTRAQMAAFLHRALG